MSASIFMAIYSSAVKAVYSKPQRQQSGGVMIKNQRIMKVIRIRPLGIITVGTKCHGNLILAKG